MLSIILIASFITINYMHYSEYLSIFLQNSLPPYLYLRKSVLLVLKTKMIILLQFLRKKFEIFLVVGEKKKPVPSDTGFL